MAPGFRLSPVSQDHGVSCDFRGAFVGSVPLLQQQRDMNGRDSWVPRPSAELSADLSNRYRVPVEFSAKAGDLIDIAGALNQGDVFRAQLAMQRLQLPDPPPVGGGLPSDSDRIASQLERSGILGALRESAPQREVPMRQTQSGSGNVQLPEQGRPAGNVAGGIIKAQDFVLPWAEPFEMPLDVPWRMPWDLPWRMPDIGPTPMNPAGQYQGRKQPIPVANPFPDDEECEKEWREATKKCWEEWMKGRLKKGAPFGKDWNRCMRGLVNERCGGNEIDASLQSTSSQS